ncbi:MAG: CoA transferase [Chloroflexi bacterium]|nr:CoA transferase [Chloroflexota bacterium]
MPDLALADVKVLDFTHYVSGPYCTKLLADYGADVIKVERWDGGDPSRRLGPFPSDEPHYERSGLFLVLNTNKRGITLNLKTEAGKKLARQLVDWADLVVESYRPGTMAGFGLDYPSLTARKPGLVYTSLSNFGQTGPYREYLTSEIVVYAMGGEMYSTGLDFREPVKLGGDVSLFQAGSIAAVATIGALLLARSAGVGQQVDVSLMETQLASQDRRMPALVAFQYTGEVSTRTPLGANGYPIGIYPCRDGYFEFMGGLGRFRNTVAMLGNPPWLQDPRWYAPAAQMDEALKAEFEAHFIPWCMEHTMLELWRLAQENHVLSGPVNTIADVAQDPVFSERGAFAEIEHPVAGRFKYPGRPFIMTETPWQLRRPAPTLGQHNEEVLCGMLGYSREDLVRLREQGVI